MKNEKMEDFIDEKIKNFDVNMREVFKVQRVSDNYLSNN
jgi:hypothetical protein